MLFAQVAQLWITTSSTRAKVRQLRCSRVYISLPPALSNRPDEHCLKGFRSSHKETAAKPVPRLVRSCSIALPFEIWQSLTGDEKRRLEHAFEEGDDLYVVTISFDIESFDEEFVKLKEKLAARGEVIATSPMVDTERTDRITFQILFAGRTNLDVADPDLTSFAGLGISNVASKPSLLRANRQAEANSLVAGLRLTPASSLSNFIRTDLDDLDRLISSTHDLFRSTAKALELALSQPYGNSGVQEELERLDVQIRRSFLNVEEKLIGLRMVSLGAGPATGGAGGPSCRSFKQ